MNKNLLYSLITLVVFSSGINAQRHEVGVRFGTSNLVGDVGSTSYLFQKLNSMSKISESGLPSYIGLVYRMNFNPHQTVRLDFGYNHVRFDDRIAKEEYRRDRRLWGTNNIYEADAIFEYNFYPVNNEQKSMLSPYIFGGVGGVLADTNQVEFVNDFNRDANGAAITPTSSNDFTTNAVYSTGKKLAMSLPFGVGLKYKFNYNWAISGEVMFRPTFSDNLDYSKFDAKDRKTTYNADIVDPGTNNSLLMSAPYVVVAQEREQDYLNQRLIGDPNTKDWVNSATLILTYSFGRPPCYCE